MVRRKKIGVKRATYVRSHRKRVYSKRETPYGKQRITTRKTIAAKIHARRYWGPAEGIPAHPILKFEWRYTDEEMDEKMITGTMPYQAGKELQKGFKDLKQYRSDVKMAVVVGCRDGFKIFQKNISPYIPERTGNLRQNVEQTVESSIPTDNKGDLPITIQIGAPEVKYASVVNKYTPQFIQIQHAGGWVMSGVQNKYKYDSGKGDPKAQFHFFGICSMQCRKAIKEGVSQQLSMRSVPWAIFVFLVKITERVTNIV